MGTCSSFWAAPVAEHDVAVDLVLGDDLETVTEDVRENITRLTIGLADNLEPIPGEISGTFDDRDRRYNPANPESDLYGDAGLNTPMRFRVGDTEQWGELEWRPVSPVGGVKTTAFSAGGVLRRLGQGETPLLGSLTRAYLSADPQPVAWWPLDDPAGSTSARSAIAGVPPLSFDENVRPGVVDAPEQTGGGKRPEFVQEETIYSGAMTSSRLTGLTTAGYVIDLMVFFGPGQTGIADVGYAFAAGSTLRYGRFALATGDSDPLAPMGFNFSLDKDDGAGGSDAESVFVFVPRNEWHHIRIEITQAGSNILMLMRLDGVVGGEYGTAIGAAEWTGETLGRLETIRLGALLEESAFNQIESFSFSDLVVFAPGPAEIGEAGIGYPGETAAERVDRLLEEEGIPVVVIGAFEDSQPMGPQPADTLQEILLECARTDAGFLHATDDDVGLTLRCGRTLYNQDPVIVLSLADEEVSAADMVIGGTLVRNDTVAQAPGGEKGRSVLTSGRMSILAPPDGVGRYDTTWNVNPEDTSLLEAHAAWHNNRGTFPGVRFRSVTVDLDGAPHRAADVAAAEIGDLVRLTDIDPGDSPDDFDGLIIRKEERVRQRRRLVTFYLVPAAPYEVGIIGATAGTVDLRGQRVDSETAALAAAVSSSATAWSVSTTGGVLMSTDSATWDTAKNGGGLYLNVGGEVVRVTNVTGAASPQAVTVVRSQNGVVKSHAAGTAVRVHRGARVGL